MQPFVKNILLPALATILLATALALINNTINANRIPLHLSLDVRTYPNLYVKSEAINLTLDDAYRQLMDEGAMFLDARPQFEFEAGHIMTAINVPAHSLTEETPVLLYQLPKDTPIVVYCSGERCEDSKTLANLLIEMDFSHVLVFAGGYEEWDGAGLPVEPDPESSP